MTKNLREQFAFHLTCASFAGIAFLAGCASNPIAPPKQTGWIKDEVADSYVFAYPLVLMGAARDAAVGSGPGQAPLNTLRHAQALPPVGAANPPTPSVDVLDSTAWLDLGDGPVIVSLPDSHGRYVDARVLDMWTNVVWSTRPQGTPRAAGIKAQTVALVGAGWKGDLPKGVKRVDVPTRNAWLEIRVQTSGAHDFAAVRKLQRTLRVVPLDVYNGEARAAASGPRGSAPDAAAVAVAPAAKVAALDAQGFFDRLAQLLPDNPPSPADPHALDILSNLGVTPDEPVKLPEDAQDAITAGLADGRTRAATPPSNMLSAHGWSWFGDGVGNYGPDYALRAYAAYAQPGIGTKDDEVRASAQVDSDGHALNGANRYVIHFTPGKLPPVRGFWSIAAYTKDGALGDVEPAHSAVSDRAELHRNRDGSLDVTVAATRRKAANWLPAPRGDFQLVMRLYAPKPEASDGTWQPPAVVRQ
jgi:hypothetical protein